jgi:ribosomal-protein-alanine N-acetyltransferase
VSGGSTPTLDGVRARDLVIVPLAAAHLDQVLAIEARVASSGWSRGIFERELVEHASRCYLVAVRPTMHGPAVVGYAGMQVLVDEAHITTLTVAEQARRRGVATRLLVELLREARARGAAAATLEVRVDNRAARALYAGFGFRPVGVRPRYYDGRVDALVMWAHDLGGAELGRLLRARDPLGEGWGSEGEGERQRAGGRRAERGA